MRLKSSIHSANYPHPLHQGLKLWVGPEVFR